MSFDAPEPHDRISCPNGHLVQKRKAGLKFFQVQKRVQGMECDVCDQGIKSSAARWRCDQHCDFDVCEECYVKASPQTEFVAGDDVARQVGTSFHEFDKARGDRLAELDANTKIPFIMVELTGEGPGLGEIEIVGKDEYGVHGELDRFFIESWGCERMDVAGDERIPFCAAQYRWPGFQVDGDEGLSNMGLMTMKLIDFVCGRLSWTLAVIAGGNVGENGSVREQQVVFKAPHPSNLVVPHILVEVRSAGYIEVCADIDEKHQGALQFLEAYITARFEAERLDGHEDFCDRYYKIGDGVIKGNAGDLESNFGILTIDLCDSIVTNPDLSGWSLVAANAGVYGEAGEHSEQQLVFRHDEHPLGDSKYVSVILNTAGNIEVNCQDVNMKKFGPLTNALHKFFTGHPLKCELQTNFRDGSYYSGTVCMRYSWPEPPENLVHTTAQILARFEYMGFELQACNQQMIVEGGSKCREQQLLFRPGRAQSNGVIEPHIIVELYLGEGSEEMYADPEEPTQLLANQYAHVKSISPRDKSITDLAQLRLSDFFINSVGGRRDEDARELSKYHLNTFLCRGRFENNMARWTMRVCDFMVDQLGWSFLTCSLCNMGDFGQQRLQQIVFRWDGDKRDIPRADYSNEVVMSEFDAVEAPPYWRNERVLAREVMQDVVVCDDEEIDALQTMLDLTYKRVLTRDRVPDEDDADGAEMPFRLVVAHAFRSEHWLLHSRLALCHDEFDEALEAAEPFPVKTGLQETVVTQRLRQHEAYFYHGTNPSSAMNILKTGFLVGHAGKNVGSMFGAGVYLAEASSKSDEYGQDDGGNTYPSLNAMLVCRAYTGKPLLVDEAGDYLERQQSEGYHCICGDRESKVGTYREFIFSAENQIYPEFTIIYRRQWDQGKVPRHMVVPTSGTTGRFWQIRSRGTDWAKLPVDVGRCLTDAFNKDEASISIEMSDGKTDFDLTPLKDGKYGTGGKGGFWQIRKPMVMS